MTLWLLLFGLAWLALCWSATQLDCFLEAQEEDDEDEV